MRATIHRCEEIRWNLMRCETAAEEAGTSKLVPSEMIAGSSLRGVHEGTATHRPVLPPWPPTDASSPGLKYHAQCVRPMRNWGCRAPIHPGWLNTFHPPRLTTFHPGEA